jgi:radical SAM superfamily enzyme YgiQ (UPF0313 family)
MRSWKKWEPWLGSMRTPGIVASTITLAPEAGSQRLRDALAKDFNEDDFLRCLRTHTAAAIGM